MFDRFQGGTHVELFDAKTSALEKKTPMKTRRDDDSCRAKTSAMPTWFGCGARVYDRAARGYVMCVHGDVQSCANVRATQPILVFQCFANASARFAFEVRVVDTANARRRLVFSSSFTEVKTSTLHCQVPLRDLPRDEWVNVLLPLAELVPACFGSASVGFKAVESIAIRGTCKLRKIFTLRGDMQAQAWTTDAHAAGAPEHAIVIPRECNFPCGVRAAAHTVIPNQEYDAEYAGDVDRAQASKSEKSFDIAFGRRVPVSQSKARDKHAMAPATYDEDSYLDDASRRPRAAASKWTNLDQIMSNLRIRDNKHGRRSCSSSTTSATSSDVSYKSSHYARSNERAASLDMRDITLGAVPHEGERSARYDAYDDDDDEEGDVDNTIDDDDDDDDGYDDEYDIVNDSVVEFDDERAEDDDDIECGLYEPTNGEFYDDDDDGDGDDDNDGDNYGDDEENTTAHSV